MIGKSFQFTVSLVLRSFPCLLQQSQASGLKSKRPKFSITFRKHGASLSRFHGPLERHRSALYWKPCQRLLSGSFGAGSNVFNNEILVHSSLES